MVMPGIIFILLVILAVVLAWKVLTGIVKTVALVAILIVAAAVVLGWSF